MKRAEKFLSWTIGIMLIWSAADGLGKSSSRGSGQITAEEAAVREVVTRYYAAYGAADAPGIKSWWNAEAPTLSKRQEELTTLLKTEKVSLTSPVFSNFVLTGERARLRAAMDLTKVNRNNQQTRQERWIRNLELINEGGNWKIWQENSAFDELAAELLKLPTEAEMAARLAVEQELKTRELVRVLYARARELFYGHKQVLPAIEVLRFARRMAEELKDDAGLDLVLNELGSVLGLAGCNEESLAAFQTDLALRERLNRPSLIARTHYNIGLVNLMREELEPALTHFQQSLQIGLGLETARQKAEMVAASHLAIGSVREKQGDYPTAALSFQAALTLSERSLDLADVQSALPETLAKSRYNLGVVRQSQGYYDEALAYYQQALIDSQRMPLKTVEIRANSLHNIGTIYALQNDHEQALSFLKQAFGPFQLLADNMGMAQVHNSRGVIYHEQRKFAEAQDEFQKAIKLSQASRDSCPLPRGGQTANLRTEIKDDAVPVPMLNNLGNLHTAWNSQFSSAEELLTRSLKLSEAPNHKTARTFTLLSMSNLRRQQGDQSAALDYARQAATLAREMGQPDLLWRALTFAGEAQAALKQASEARQNLNDAIRVIEELRWQVAGGELQRQRFFEDKLTPYRALLDLLVAEKKEAEALLLAERAKARVLLDVFERGRINVTKRMTRQEQDQERDLNDKLHALNVQLEREERRRQPASGRLAELAMQRQQARLTVSAFQTQLYTVHPELRTQRGAAPALTLAEAGALLPDARSAILEFAVTSGHIHLFVLTRKPSGVSMVNVFPVKIEPENLTKLIERFQRNIANRRDVEQPGKELYQLLLAAARPLLAGKNKLIIVPDGPLWELPFQATRSPENRYLVEDFAISYAPSLTALREMVKLRERRLASAPASLFAVGVSLAGQPRAKRQCGAPQEPLKPLPEAEPQVRQVGQLYAPGHRVTLTGASATEAQVKAEAGKHRVLHFATHGVLDNCDPMYSHLVLAQPGDGEDGLLEAREILQMDWRAELAVLAACETARGRVGEGEGVIGLTWALFVAGVPATIVSQASVSTDSVGALLPEFHQQWQRARLTKAEALQQAALKLLRTKGNLYSDPYYWSRFVVVGDGF